MFLEHTIDRAGLMPRLLVLHGPPGFDPSAALAECAVTLRNEDTLIIAEHDLAVSVRLEQRIEDASCNCGATEEDDARSFLFQPVSFSPSH